MAKAKKKKTSTRKAARKTARRTSVKKSAKARNTKKKKTAAKRTAGRKSRPTARKKKVVKKKKATRAAKPRKAAARKKAKKAKKKATRKVTRPSRPKKAKVKKASRKAVKKAAKKVTKKAAKKVTKKAAKKVTKKTAKKAARKPVVKKAAPKKAATRKTTNPAQKKTRRAGRQKSGTPEGFVLPPLPERPKPTYTPMKQRPDVMVVPKSSTSSGKKRYSDAELKEFQGIINRKLTDARRELQNLQASLLSANNHGTDDTATTFKMLEDGSETLAKEEAGQLAARQRKFIEQLENALVRIENKTYGVCRVTGKLIPKERLRAVPHTTQSIEAKMQQYRD